MGTRRMRGALVVLEGCDRSGKSTQCRLLVDALRRLGHKVLAMHFPERNTTIGRGIDAYLTKREDVNDRSIHLLFSANRWEFESQIKDELSKGTTVVVDRYAYSGVAFTAAKRVDSIDLDWCKGPDRGLPAPDVVFFLKLSPEAAQKRSDFGEERYERVAFQEIVAKQYELIRDEYWEEVDASKKIEDIHKQLLQTSLETMEKVKMCPIGVLWN